MTKKEALKLVEKFRIEPGTLQTHKSIAFALFHVEKMLEECDINRKVYYLKLKQELEKIKKEY